MNKQEFERTVKTHLESKEGFDKFININNTLKSLGAGLLIFGASAVVWNVFSTIRAIVEEAGAEYIGKYFFTLFFSMDGTNIIMTSIAIAGIIAIVAGIVLLVIYKTKEGELNRNLFADTSDEESLVMVRLYPAGKAAVLKLEDEEDVDKLAEFIGDETTDEAVKLAKYFRRLTNQATPKQVQRAIEKHSGMDIKVSEVLVANQMNIIELDEGFFLCSLKGKNGTLHQINIKKMQKESIIG